MKNIIFDIGMVLVDFHWKSTMEKLGIPADVIDTLDHNMINLPMWTICLSQSASNVSRNSARNAAAT